MKIGVIFVGFQCEDMLNDSLRPWIEARAQKLADHEFLICGVSLPFQGFPQEEKRDNTRDMFQHYVDNHAIDHLITEPENVSETKARGMALEWFRSQKVELVIQVDADEFYELGQIERIFSFVIRNPFVTWFRLCLKNYVFDDKTYLIDPFTPPRIHRIRDGNYEAHSFNQDNDIAYGGTITRDIIPQERFASMTVPKGIAWIKHKTWPNSDRSRRKIEYQLKGRKWPSCSFTWDDSKGGLIWNPAFPTPDTLQDE